MPRSIDALRQAEEDQHYALQLSVDEQGQIAIKLGRCSWQIQMRAGEIKSTNWAGEHHAG
jgi:hypothetical protein